LSDAERDAAATIRRENGVRFAERRMAENYRYRPPYSPEVFVALSELIRDHPRNVLDAGCGPGKIARVMVDSVDRIDAVDPSIEMIRVGQSLPNGDHPKIRWLNARIEDVALAPPYALIVAGASFHWMNPEIALHRFAEVISQHGMFAVLDGDAPIDPPWAAKEQDLMIDLVTKIEGARPKWWMSARERSCPCLSMSNSNGSDRRSPRRCNMRNRSRITYAANTHARLGRKRTWARSFRASSTTL